VRRVDLANRNYDGAHIGGNGGANPSRHASLKAFVHPCAEFRVSSIGTTFRGATADARRPRVQGGLSQAWYDKPTDAPKNKNTPGRLVGQSQGVDTISHFIYYECVRHSAILFRSCEQNAG